VVAIRFGNGEVGMKKQIGLSILALAFLGLGVVHGQESIPSPTPSVLPPPNPRVRMSNSPDDSPPPSATPDDRQHEEDGMRYPNPGVSSWLAYPRSAECCSRVGGCGPIDMEAYLRSGITQPLHYGIFGRTMRMGWDIGGGVRTLFFNPAETGAWTVDLGITNMNFNTTTHTQTFILDFQKITPSPIAGVAPTVTTIPKFFVTPSGLNDTTLNLSLGREFYLWGSTHDCKTKDWKWRAGFDCGGRWGSDRVDLVEIRHRTSTIGGIFFSVHTDAEIPCGCAIFYTGLRLEYSYIFSDILQGNNNTDLETVNATWTFGLRY
jgi:hypothetical protein